MTKLRVIAFSLVVLSCASPDGERPTRVDSATPGFACGIDAATHLDGNGIGALRIGASVDVVRAQCRVLEDTTTLGPEALPQRTLLVDLGADSVTAVVDEDRIWRLHLVRPVFRTPDSLGVGSSVSALRTRPGVEVLTGENQVFLTVPQSCGLSFRLGGLDAEMPPPLNAIADSVRVEEVLVVGCSSGGVGPA